MRKRPWHHNAAPHRKLYRTARGADVKRFQIGLNARLEHDPRGHAKLSEDGYFGDQTLHAWKQVRDLIGLPRWLGVTQKAQLNVRQPNTRSKAAVRRSKKCHQQLAAGSDGEKALAYLSRYAGKTESPAGSNDAPFLRAWRTALSMAWMNGQPWCGFACIAAWELGAKHPIPRDTTYTPTIVSRALRGDGFKAVHSTEAKEGDLVVFDFDGGGADHVGLARGPAVGGLIPTCEGNTSSSDAGSQSNGGGVFNRVRPVGLIAVVARPE